MMVQNIQNVKTVTLKRAKCAIVGLKDQVKTFHTQNSDLSSKLLFPALSKSFHNNV